MSQTSPANTARPRARARGRTSVALAGCVLVGLAIAIGLRWRMPDAVTRSGVDLGTLSRGLTRDRLNLLFVTFDTTRADRLGCYGYADAGTPNVDRLAAEGVQFDQAVSAVPLTLPAHSTIFTGTLPTVHGVRDNGGYVLDPRHTTLAEVLSGAGWQTAAFVSAYVLDGKWGLDQGFGTYYDHFSLSKYKTLSLGSVSRPASETVDAALPWLEGHRDGRFFAWLHFYDPHSPYEPPEPFKSRFAGRPYQGEIATTDFQLGRVLDWLDERGLRDRTIVVVMGDHGESLNEHGEGTHGLFVYDATVHVPLVVRTPFNRLHGRRVAGVVRSEDVMPTLLDLLGIAPPGEVQGQSVVGMMTGDTDDLGLAAYSESYYARNHFGWSGLRSLRAGRFKYIQAPRPELYDLERDPAETANLYTGRRPLAERMAAELARMGAEREGADAGPAAVDPETRERLAALGYLGTFVHVPAQAGGELPDPKDKIDIFNLMLSAQEEGGGGEAAPSKIARLERVIALDPNVMDAWLMLGNEYMRAGEPRQAIAKYRRALELRPDYDLATVNLANAYREIGEYDAAIVGYEEYLKKDPRNAYIRYQLGELYLDRNELDKAEPALRAALKLDDRVAAARNALGVVAFKRGDLAEAEREIREALASKADVALAHYNLALIAEARGDVQTAIKEYEAEIDLHPTSFKAAFNLGKLYEQLGRPAKQEAAFRQSISMNPRFAEGYFFLAKLLLDGGSRYDEAIALARQGLTIGPRSEFAPLGHYVLADIYSRTGRAAEAAEEAARGRALEAGQRRRSIE